MASARWSLVQYAATDRGAVQVGVLSDGVVRRAPDWLPGSSLMDVLDRWTEVEARLRELEVADHDAVPGARLVAPLTYPRKLLCAGANYYSHAEEMGTQRPDPDGEPFFFLKPPTTTLVGAHDEVRLPASANVDWEAELAVVIGRRGRHIPEAEAILHVAGYTVANDLSARGRFPRQDAVFPAFGWDWFQHKAFDGFCPLGPGIVPAAQVDDPQDLAVRLTVNGEVKQDASTADMVITVPRLIAAASRTLTLEPGDVLLTGTPSGVGMPHRTFLRAGDVVVTEIDGIGRLENRMVAA